MTRTSATGIALVAAMTLMLAVAMVAFVTFDSAGIVGLAVGAGIGLLNLAVGTWFTRRALGRGMKDAMAVMMGGFLVRLLLVVSLLMLFNKVDAVNEVAFALSFMVFFFVYLALEIALVDRSLRGNGSPA